MQPVVADSFALSELRAGVLLHSVDPFMTDIFTRVPDVTFEALFDAPYLDSFTWLNGKLRVRVGASLNFGGLESMANVGLNWHVPVGDTGVWLEGTLGGAVHNGALSGAVYPARNLGCPVLFYEAASVGTDLSDNTTVMLTFEHASHAGLCGNVNNRGLTNLGVRFGVRF